MRKIIFLLFTIAFFTGCIGGPVPTTQQASIQEKLIQNHTGIEKYSFNSQITLENQTINATGTIKPTQNWMSANYTITNTDIITRKAWIHTQLQNNTLYIESSSAENPGTTYKDNKTVETDQLILEQLYPLLTTVEPEQNNSQVMVETTPTKQNTTNYLDLRLNKLITSEQRINTEKIGNSTLKAWIQHTENTTRLTQIELTTEYNNDTITDKTKFTYTQVEK